MEVISIANNKRGVGKTTTTLNLANALMDRKRNVVMVDVDPQATLTDNMGLTNFEDASIADVLLGFKTMDYVLWDSPPIRFIPSDINLSKCEIELMNKNGSEMLLKKSLNTIADRFDIALLDLPPSLGMLTINGLVASDAVIIPAKPEVRDVRGLQIFIQYLEVIKNRFNPKLRLIGILPTFYEQQHKVLQSWKESKLPILPFYVNKSSWFSDPPMSGYPASVFEPELGKAFEQLAELIDYRKFNAEKYRL
jgi:chromosome partitioning protein